MNDDRVVDASRPSLEACSWCGEPFLAGQLAVVCRGFARSGESSWYYEACGAGCADIIETLMRLNRRGM